MKTKYKILIASILVLSMLTAFAVTSFAYTSTDITYDGNTYTFNDAIVYSDLYQRLQIWDYDTLIFIDSDGVSHTYEHDYVLLTFTEGGNDNLSIGVFYNGHIQTTYYLVESNQSLNIVLTGDYKYCLTAFDYFDNSLTNDNTSEQLEYDVWYMPDYTLNQINILNSNIPNPLEKVNDFLGYLSTALNKLTTMIITNQILILFIVAVPVISFVIGSFKRIKDAGRV